MKIEERKVGWKGEGGAALGYPFEKGTKSRGTIPEKQGRMGPRTPDIRPKREESEKGGDILPENTN